MKRLKLFEEMSDRKTLYDIIDDISSRELEPEEIENYISIESDFDIEEMNHGNLILKMSPGIISELMNIEYGVIEHMNYIVDNDYSVELENDELDYLHYYLNAENIQAIRDIANWLDWDFPEESKNKDGGDNLTGEIKEMFEYLGLDVMFDEMKTEISVMKSESTKQYVKKVLDESPISVEKNFRRWDKKEYGNILTIDYSKTLEFLDKYNLKDNVLSIYNLLLLVGKNLDYSYDVEFNSSEFDTDVDLNRIFENEIFDYWDIEEKKPEQNMYLNLIQNNCTDDIKERIDEIDWNDKVKNKLSIKKLHGYNYLVEYANKKSDLYDWFVSDEFIEKMESKKVDKELLKYLYDLKLKIFGEDLGLF